MSTDPAPEIVPEVTRADDAEPLLVIPVTPPRKGWPILAWLVIIGVVVYIAGGYRTQRILASVESDERARLGEKIMGMQERYVVGAASIFGNAAQFYSQSEPFNSGPMAQRVQFVILAGELVGPEEAKKRLDELDPQDREESRPRRILRRLYDDYSRDAQDAPSISEAEREQLLDRYGWFGELALHPAGSPDTQARQAVIGEARQTFLMEVGGLSLIGVLALVGFFGLMTLLVFAVQGSVRSKVRTEGSYGGIYAETFALYLLLFLALSALVSTVGGSVLLMGALASLLSLLALAWPVLRGIPWQQVREDIGLTKGRSLVLEPVLGIAGYAMALPILVVGVAIFVLLMLSQGALKGLGAPPESLPASENVTEPGPPGASPNRVAGSPSNPMLPDDLPAHPIVFMDTKGWWNKALLLFLACVAAPLVEETMFRGVLHRHLRGATQRFGSFLSIVLSGTIASFIFAAIHPQGLIAIPALMALAYGFTILREWRGTLIPAMIAHGFNNGIMLTALMLIMGN